ncbi:MAG: hypothetical protein SFU87_19055 [Chitinophagaceae bacterium]|nr:hypothetical protein [Chitinophagaceae bacterium]
MEKRIKKSYICREVENYLIDESLSAIQIPKVGDIAVFEVTSIGKHSSIQSADKRNAGIYTGDLIMAAFGTRYATEQFEGYVPKEPLSEYHILGAGGTVGVIHSMHSKFSNIGPTRLKLIGYAVDRKGTILNTKWIKHKEILTYTGVMQSLTRIILSVGSSMDSGKTTTAAHLVRGLKKTGMKTGFIKLTGTVFTKDCDLNYDHGADVVTDFGSMGFPSTYMCELGELLNLYETLLSQINASELDYVVMEIADGIYQRETEMLLTHAKFMSGVDAVIFSAGDSLSAVQGVRSLQEMHIVPTALCGLFTASPLLIREVKNKIHIPVFTIEQLASGEITNLLEQPLGVIA